METLAFVHSKTRESYNLVAEKYHTLFHNELDTKEYDRKLLDCFVHLFNPGAKICDAGCGPSAHIGKYLSDRGMDVVGVDISDRCIEIASQTNPGMDFRREDFAALSFTNDCFDGMISYYSIINTPKSMIDGIFNEFNRVTKAGGRLLVVVKAGVEEGYIRELIGVETEIYSSLFNEEELVRYFTNSGFAIEFIERRKPYDSEIQNERIFVIGRKIRNYE
jgi:ubiquinone/menaquinone biosynthesis C-methylase UbiE